MASYQVCVCFVLRTTGDGTRQVLLGRKKTGLGAGKIVGLGGKIEPGESPVEAIAREVTEESGLVVTAQQLSERGYIRYAFPHRESWSQDSTVFVAESFTGEPSESDEVAPAWYDVAALPLGEMWDDAKYWLPAVLSARTVQARFVFGDDLSTVSDSAIEFGDQPG
jgi:8-oxo-dGTP diphosphatase